MERFKIWLLSGKCKLRDLTLAGFLHEISKSATVFCDFQAPEIN